MSAAVTSISTLVLDARIVKFVDSHDAIMQAQGPTFDILQNSETQNIRRGQRVEHDLNLSLQAGGELREWAANAGRRGAPRRPSPFRRRCRRRPIACCSSCAICARISRVDSKKREDRLWEADQFIQVQARIDSPGWFEKIVKHPVFIAGISAFSAWLTSHLTKGRRHRR